MKGQTVELYQAVQAAEQRIRPYVHRTPLEYAPALSALGGAQVYLKLENVQHTRSFKLRGVMNKLLSMQPAERARGVVAASSGNHGAALAYGCRQLEIEALIFVPERAAPAKVAAIRQLGAAVRYHGNDSVVTERFARQYAEDHSLTYISPYNDWEIVYGQGTVAAELVSQLPQIDAVLVAVGGGGLIGGMAGYLKARQPAPSILGCLPANSPVMAASVAAGQLLEMPTLPTLSDGTAGGIEANAITFEPCRTLVDEFFLAEEAAIATAMRTCLAEEHLLIEGAAGVAVAAYLHNPARWQGKNIVIVICGGNVGIETVRQIVQIA
ncbi:MAG TPA: threonine/serine dehydratase [Kouleothrix sp.]|nr:threonine/serine dehydratase [Kouleothrix sp.]